MKKIYKVLKRLMIITLSIVGLIFIVAFFYMKQAKFGKSPSGERLAIMKKSPNFKDGKFQNINHTPEITEGYNYFEVTYEFFFKKNPRRIPVQNIPSIKTNLLSLPDNQDILVWFGHSSYYIQIDGKKILVDPVFSKNASPLPGTNKSFPGTDVYAVPDLPEIDYLFISHDHYDHVDYETLIQLREKTKQVICGLGVGAHLEYWGYPADRIIERDWNEKVSLDTGFEVFTAPARHFSGRGFSRNNTLWVSFILQTPTMKIYIGGDSGYDTHYSEIGNKFGPIDLAILDNGQYDIKWRYIHHLPEEVLTAAKDLKARRLFPVHSSKFAMANHAWDEPLKKITELNKAYNFPLVTPMIGEIVYLKNNDQKFEQWWE